MGSIILECIVTILVAIIVCYAIPFLKEKKLYDAIAIAVRAAEQIYKNSGMGKEKFAYVKNWIEETFNVDDTDLKNIIESAVYELNAEKEKK